MATKTPLDEIEEGLAKGNLKKIAAGFKKMTGKKVELPVKDAAPSLPKVVREALLFYGNQKNWVRGGDDFEPTPPPVAKDKGMLAAQALSQLGAPDDDDDEDDTEEFEMALPAAFEPEPVLLTVPKRPARQNGRIDMSEFEVQHGKGVGGKNYGRKEPVKPGMKNVFVDTGALEANNDFDQKVVAKLRPSPRREAAVLPQTITVVCSRCDRPYDADPYDVRSTATEEGDGMSNICPGCIRGAIPKRN